MSYTKTHDLAVVTGQYEKNGETKNNYENVGMIISDGTKKLILIKRTFNPAGVPNPEGKSSVIVNAFPIKKDEKKEEKKPATPPPQGDFDDDIPF